ncbi:unnamed protein product [Choristocarpus tenellus]
MIKAEVANADSESSMVYSVLLILVNSLLLLSICWQAWVTLRFMFSSDHFQDAMLGIDVMDRSGIGKVFTKSRSGEGQKMNLLSQGARAEPKGGTTRKFCSRDDRIGSVETRMTKSLGGEMKEEKESFQKAS